MKKPKISVKHKLYHLYIHLSNLRNFNIYKTKKTIPSIATGTIMSSEKHSSIHVKHHMTNSKYNILLKETGIYIPFDCEISNISDDYSTIFLKPNETLKYAIYLDKSSLFIRDDDFFSKLKEGVKYKKYDKLININISKVYDSGYLPIISFCIFEDFDYVKVFYGEAIACTNTALLFY